MLKRTFVLVNMLLALGLAANAFPVNLRTIASLSSKTPAYFPGDGVCVVYHPEEFFTFLWPEKWSEKSNLSFVLVTMDDGQTAEEAVSKNIPLYKEEGIQSYYVQYPWDAPPLESGEYAWQVKNANGKVLLTTQFCVGSVNTSRYEIAIPDNVWMYLKEKPDGSYHTAYDRVLYIHYTEPYEVSADQKLRFCVYDSHRNIVLRTNDTGSVVEYALIQITSPTIQTGENWLKISVGQNCFYYDESMHDYPDDYYLEVWDGKGEKNFLRFRCVHSTPRLVPTTNENN